MAATIRAFLQIFVANASRKEQNIQSVNGRIDTYI
jgi:hypothetical protein